MAHLKFMLGFLLSFSMIQIGHCVAGTFDSSNIRSIKTEVHRIKDMSETIVNEVKKQKEVITSIQNEFKAFNADIKWIKKALADLDNFLNKTISNDTQFIREKIVEFSTLSPGKAANQRTSEKGKTLNNSGNILNSASPTSNLNRVNKETDTDASKKAGPPFAAPGLKNVESETSTSTSTSTTTEISKMLKLFQG